MNFRDFLMDNYIYIIIIIVLSIVTIIGFLADKKKTADKRPDTMGGSIENPGMDGNSMPYQPQQNTNGPIAFNQNNNPVENNMQYNQPQPENNIISPVNPGPIINNVSMAPEVTPMAPTQNVGNEMKYNAPSPVESMNAAVNNQSESLYQPLPEQKPAFIPVEPNMNMANNQMPQGGVEPMINPVPIQPINEPAPMPNVQPNQMNGINMAQNSTINQMPNPVPVQPMPNQGGNTIPNPITPPQPVSPQPINYPYGPGNNNNQFMQ